MPTSQRVVQVCLFIVAAIALVGGTVQMVLGQPETTPRLDNVHRFLAGVYFSMGVIAFWAAWTVRRQGTLVYLIALGVLLAGCGRLYSMSQVGLPKASGNGLSIAPARRITSGDIIPARRGLSDGPGSESIPSITLVMSAGFGIS